MESSINFKRILELDPTWFMLLRPLSGGAEDYEIGGDESAVTLECISCRAQVRKETLAGSESGIVFSVLTQGVYPTQKGW
jgi:hypothetical protein